MLLLITGKFGNCLYSAYIISNFEIEVMVSPKNSKSNKTRIFAQSCERIRIFLFDSEVEQALFMLENYNIQIQQNPLII